MSDPTTETETKAKTAEELEIEQLEAELIAAQDKRANAAAERERLRRGPALRAELEKAKREALEEEKLAELEKKFGLVNQEIAVVQTIDGMVVVKKPDGVKTRHWLDKHAASATQDELRMLIRPCVVYPDLGVFDEMMKSRPAAVPDIATQVLKLGGLRLKELGGK